MSNRRYRKRALPISPSSSFSCPHLSLSFSDPYELGAYWPLCVVFAQIGSFVAVYVLGESGNLTFSVQPLWYMLAALEVTLLLMFGIFITHINPEYIHTFFTTMTGPQLCFKKWSHFAGKQGSDQYRIYVFTDHPSYYAAFYDEVKLYVADNYKTWVENRPDFFSDFIKSKIPADMIPADGDDEIDSEIEELTEKIETTRQSRAAFHGIKAISRQVLVQVK